MTNRIYHPTPVNENLANVKLRRIAKSITIKTKGKCISKRLFIGLFSFVISMAIFVIQPNRLYRKMKLTLIEDGELFDLWLRANIDPITKMYLFNITNKEEFLAGKEKLRVQEVGPYIYKVMRLPLKNIVPFLTQYPKMWNEVLLALTDSSVPSIRGILYRETSVHQNPVFNHTAGTVFTHPKHKFEWAPELNTRSENDTFLLPNIPLLLYANRFSGRLPFVKMAANTYSLTDRDPITRQSVRDVLFGVANQYILLGNIFMPQWIPFDKFGLFEQISGVIPDTWEAYTGEKNFHEAGRIVRYNNLTTLPQWEAPCSRVVGATDGKKFGNDIDSNETLYIFHRSLCRTFPIVPAGPETVSDQWLPTAPYKIPDDALDNGETNSENKCFCLEKNCLPSGLIDLKKCYYEFSVAASFPHFYKGHPSLLENIDGLQPNSSLHESEWHINREAGVLTNCSVKLQFNLVLKNVDDITGCQPFSNMIVPVAWGELAVPRLHPTTALRLYIGLQIFPIIEKISAIFWLIMGVLCIYFEIKAERGGKNSTKRRYGCHEKQTNFNHNVRQIKSLLP